jgi:hypothetical protein
MSTQSRQHGTRHDILSETHHYVYLTRDAFTLPLTFILKTLALGALVLKVKFPLKVPAAVALSCRTKVVDPPLTTVDAGGVMIENPAGRGCEFFTCRTFISH